MDRILRDYQVVMAKAIADTCSVEGESKLDLSQWPDYPTVFQLNIDLGTLHAQFHV